MGRKRKQNSTPTKTTTKVIGPIDNLFKLKSNNLQILNDNSNDSSAKNSSNNDDEIIIISDNSNDKIVDNKTNDNKANDNKVNENKANDNKANDIKVNDYNDNKANLCGETEIDILIELIDEWICTEDELLDEDVATINKFFLDLACENNKEKLKEIVDHFHESISKRQQHAVDWQTMYNEIIGLISPEFEELNFEFF